MALRKKTWNIWIDTLSYAAFVVLAMTGIIMYFILPPGSGKGMTIWNLDRHEWGDIHFWAAVSFFGLLVVHLILHWKWIVSVLKGTPRTASRSRFLLGATGLIAIILISLAPILSPVQKDGKRGHGAENHATTQARSDDEHEDQRIKGSLTLTEVTELSGIPMEVIIDFLELPRDVDADMRLGKLKSEYGFDMHELRTFIEEYRP